MQLWHTTWHSWSYYILWSKICEIFNLFIHFLCTLDSLFLVFFLAPTFLESINGKKYVFRWLQGKFPTTSTITDSDIVILQKTFLWYRYWCCYCKRAFLDINIDIAIAKYSPVVLILILLLQNTLCWYRYWCCYCTTPSSVIDIDIAIAYYLSLVLLFLLLLINGLQTIESQTISKKSLLLSPDRKRY